eukprot:UN34881
MVQQNKISFLDYISISNLFYIFSLLSLVLHSSVQSLISTIFIISFAKHRPTTFEFGCTVCRTLVVFVTTYRPFNNNFPDLYLPFASFSGTTSLFFGDIIEFLGDDSFFSSSLK